MTDDATVDAMTETSTTPTALATVTSPWPTVSDAELRSTIAKGQANNGLPLEEVLDLLGPVELSEELIAEVRNLFGQHGVELDEGADEALADAKQSELIAAAIEQLLDEAEETPVTDDARRQERRSRLEEVGWATSLESSGSADSVHVYLKEIGRVPLLSSAGEVRLAKRIQAGMAASEEMADLAAAGRLDGLDVGERRRLQRVIRDGDRAKRDLTRANLRLVVSIAKRYSNRGMALLDLVQEGNLGLMRAVEKFDHTKGFKFSTYATWWIRQSITRSIADQSRTIRIPVHMVETMNRVQHMQRQLFTELEREPTVDELAARTDLTPAKVREILRFGLDPISLEAPVGEEDSSLGDFIEDTRIESPADVATRGMLGEALLEALSELNEREQEVVRMRFGLIDGQPRTLEEVGRAFGVTRERIRQIESKTLAKLRHPQRREKLRDYLR